jgi:hypothetical protein
MTDYYVDFNRGLDTNAGTSKNAAFKSLSKLSALSLPAGSNILLANDSFWDIQEDLTAANYLTLNNLTQGVSGNRVTIQGYDYSIATGTKPIVSYTMYPQSSWWTWDATVSAWYLQLSTAIWGNGGIGIVANGVYAVSTGAGVRNGNESVINSIVGTNGVTANTFRWVVPSTNSGTRLYVAGYGLSATTNPTDYYGQGNIKIMPAGYISLYQPTYTRFTGIEFRGGGLYATYGAGDVIKPGLELDNCAFNDVGGIIQNSMNSATSGTQIDYNIHDNTANRVSRMGIYLTGYTTGTIKNNHFSYGNLNQSAGGFVYTQLKKPSSNGYMLVTKNYAEYALNGNGERRFDGSCYYADYLDNGTVFDSNIAAHSYKATQGNGGAQTTWVRNIAYDCCKFGTWTDAQAVGTSNYVIDSNTWISSNTPNDYFHGDQESTTGSMPAIGMWTNTGIGITGLQVTNNLLIARGDFSLMGSMGTYNNTIMSGGLPIIKNNALVGNFGSKPKIASISGTDYTSTYPTQINGAFNNDIGYVNGLPATLSASSIASGAGLQATTQETDYNGTVRFSPRSIGALEVSRTAQVFSPAWLGL